MDNYKKYLTTMGIGVIILVVVLAICLIFSYNSEKRSADCNNGEWVHYEGEKKIYTYIPELDTCK